MGTISNFSAGGNPAMDQHPIQERVEIVDYVLKASTV